MQDDILKLVVELTNMITEELNGSEKIASLMGEFERRGLQAGIDVHPFVRKLTPESAPASAKDGIEEKPASAPPFSYYDAGFLKAMRILDSEPSPGSTKGDTQEKPSSPSRFSDRDLAFLKAMRILDSESSPDAAKEDIEEGPDQPP